MRIEFCLLNSVVRFCLALIEGEGSKYIYRCEHLPSVPVTLLHNLYGCRETVIALQRLDDMRPVSNCYFQISSF